MSATPFDTYNSIRQQLSDARRSRREIRQDLIDMDTYAHTIEATATYHANARRRALLEAIEVRAILQNIDLTPYPTTAAHLRSNYACLRQDAAYQRRAHNSLRQQARDHAGPHSDMVTYYQQELATLATTIQGLTRQLRIEKQHLDTHLAVLIGA